MTISRILSHCRAAAKSLILAVAIGSSALAQEAEEESSLLTEDDDEQSVPARDDGTSPEGVCGASTPVPSTTTEDDDASLPEGSCGGADSPKDMGEGSCGGAKIEKSAMTEDDDTADTVVVEPPNVEVPAQAELPADPND